jgi:hypothetical protein
MSPTPRSIAVNFLWDFILGPILAVFPASWRQRVIPWREIQWQRPGTISGLYEMTGAIVALGYWYMFAVQRFISLGLQAAESNKLGQGLSDHQLGGTALFFWALHPLTWLFFGLFFEGAVRLCSAAFGDKTLGTAPLCILERLIFWTTHPREAHVAETLSQNAASFAGAIRERAHKATHRELQDQLFSHTNGPEELLEIHSSRRKTDWEPPKIVRFGEVYYHLEKAWTTKGARPFCYELRRLAAGVPSRRVLVYQGPEEPE